MNIIIKTLIKYSTVVEEILAVACEEKGRREVEARGMN